MTKKIVEEIKQLLVRKRVNFLIGSGASLPAIKLMSSFELSEEEKHATGKTYNTDALRDHVKNVSRITIRPELFTSTEDEFQGDIRESKTSAGKYEVPAALKNNIESVSSHYEEFISNLVSILNKSNSRNSRKNINIFTTNYDLFIEKAVESSIHKNPNLFFNDGANGYFDRKLDSYNFDRSISYKNQFDSISINEEIPSISILKPHGSVNWEFGNGAEDSDIFIRNKIVGEPVVVPPDGHEDENTYVQNHYYEMLRVFQVELSKPESVLIVFGFSFGDKHIAKMVQRALSNPQIMVYVFSYSNSDKQKIKDNLKAKAGVKNLKILGPEDILDNPNSSDGLDLERLNNVIFKIGDYHVS